MTGWRVRCGQELLREASGLDLIELVKRVYKVRPMADSGPT